MRWCVVFIKSYIFVAMVFSEKALANELFVEKISRQDAIRTSIAEAKNKDSRPHVSDDFGSLSIGHNLSTNNFTLKKDQWTLGSLYTAYGITDRWSVGTSLFVLSSFEMLNAMTRYAVLISKKEKIGFDFAYFKTFGGKRISSTYCTEFSDTNNDGALECTGSEGYEYYTGFVMEAVSGKFTYTYQIYESYRFNTTLSYFYYFDDSKPFSFRMDPANNDPFSINLSSLHEFKINKMFFVNLEAGLWGLNYEYLYYHTGFSVGVQNSGGMIAIGASSTFSPTFPKARAKSFSGYDSRASIHPEIHIQLFF